jgi:hypothetical protein
MGGKQTVETGPDGNRYAYSTERPENGGVITSLMDVYNNNVWLVEAIARAATDNRWPRVDVKAGNVGPGVNGGFQGSVKSPMNKGRAYKLPGIGLAGDWPGGWTQTYAQADTEAGPHGFDEEYFVRQVAGLSQLAAELMLVEPIVIDLGWGALKSAILKLPESTRPASMNAYLAAFRHVEAGERAQAKAGLDDVDAQLVSAAPAEQRTEIRSLVEGLRAKLA